MPKTDLKIDPMIVGLLDGLEARNIDVDYSRYTKDRIVVIGGMEFWSFDDKGNFIDAGVLCQSST